MSEFRYGSNGVTDIKCVEQLYSCPSQFLKWAQNKTQNFKKEERGKKMKSTIVNVKIERIELTPKEAENAIKDYLIKYYKIGTQFTKNDRFEFSNDGVVVEIRKVGESESSFFEVSDTHDDVES